MVTTSVCVRGDYWYLIDTGQGCCYTPYNAQLTLRITKNDLVQTVDNLEVTHRQVLIAPGSLFL